MSEDNLRASLGSDHMQPVDKAGPCHAASNAYDQPVPAPREISAIEIALEALREYAECCDGCSCGDGWSHDTASEAIRKIEQARAPQTAPRDPYKRGQLLP